MKNKIRVTRGDGVTLQLRCRLGTSGYVDLTGAEFVFQVSGSKGPVTIDDQDAFLINPDQSGQRGRLTVQIEPTESELFKIGNVVKFVLKVTQNDEPIHFHGQMEVLSRTV